IRTDSDTHALLNELVALLRLTHTEAAVARVRMGQARNEAIRRELEQNAREADLRAEQLQGQLRRLGGTPDLLADVVGYFTALTKGAAEQAAPFSEALLGDLALEHQLRDRVLFTRVLAEAGGHRQLVELLRQLEADHTETIEWIRVRLAEVAQGGPAALAATPFQATIGVFARLATLPARQGADLVNKAANLLRRGQTKAAQTAAATQHKAQDTTRATEEVLEAGRDAALARAQEVAPFENVRSIARQTRANLGTTPPTDLPIRDYDTLTGGVAIEAIKNLDDAADVRMVLAYEQAHKDRKTVTSAAEQRMSALAAQAVTS
ncbi:MAG TPA: hypothetical protein VER57_00770, partial [Cyanobium sp.]|nr:hypothetical protein [Cyanobium sp.]